MATSIAAWLIAAFVLYRISESDRRLNIDRRCSALGVFAAAAIASLPVIVAEFLRAVDHSGRTKFIVAAAYVVSLFSMVRFEKPRIGGKALSDLTESQDKGLSESVRRISDRLEIRAPSVRLLPSVGAPPPAQAFACGLLRPKIIVGDGITLRFPERERDAVIAHELAHIATGSLWCLAAVIPVCASIVVVSAIHLDDRFVAAILIGWIVFAGLKRIVSRPFEIACDLSAGRNVGWDAMSSSLEKIHSLHIVDADSLIGRLAYAAATHPHPDVRRAALARRAERDVWPGPVPLVKEIGHRVGAWVVFLVWTAAIVVVLGELAAQRSLRLSAVIVLVVYFAPNALILAAALPAFRRWLGLLGRIPRSALAAILCLTSYAVLGLGLLTGRKDATIVGVVAAVTSLVFLLSASRSRKAMIAVTNAIRDRKFNDAVAAFEQASKEHPRDALFRLLGALAFHLAGHRKPAIAICRKLIAADPKFHGASLNLGMFLLDTHPKRSVVIFGGLLRTEPKSAALACYLARALRVVGRFDEAKVLLADAIHRSVRADAGLAHGLAASVAVECGEKNAAKDHLTAASNMNIGHPFNVIAAADYALAFDTLESAEKAVVAAEAIEQSVPTALIGAELAILRRKLEERRRAQPTSE